MIVFASGTTFSGPSYQTKSPADTVSGFGQSTGSAGGGLGNTPFMSYGFGPSAGGGDDPQGGSSGIKQYANASTDSNRSPVALSICRVMSKFVPQTTFDRSGGASNTSNASGISTASPP